MYMFAILVRFLNRLILLVMRAKIRSVGGLIRCRLNLKPMVLLVTRHGLAELMIIGGRCLLSKLVGHGRRRLV